MCLYLAGLTETSVVLHLCDVLTSQMVHFIHQLAYYITFEVCHYRLPGAVGRCGEMVRQLL